MTSHLVKKHLLRRNPMLNAYRMSKLIGLVVVVAILAVITTAITGLRLIIRFIDAIVGELVSDIAGVVDEINKYVQEL